MPDFILDYDILEAIAKYSNLLGKRSEEYAEQLENKIINAIERVTGPSSGYLTGASDSVRDKINALNLKSEAFYHFAEQILNLLEVAEEIDQEVAAAIASGREYFLEHHESLRIDDWKAKLLGLYVELKNSIPLLGTIADILAGLDTLFESLKDSIKHWYECEGGKRAVNRVLDKIETYYNIVGLATTGIGVAYLFNGKAYELLKGGAVSYSDLNNSEENGNVDLKNEIKKIYTKVTRDVNDFMTGGAVAVDNNFYNGSMQKLSGFEEDFQPDSTAFKLGKFAGDAASLVTGVGTTILGGLEGISGIALDTTGAGAIAGVPLSVAGAGVFAYGGAVSVTSARGIINDGLSLMSGDGGSYNEGAGNLKPQGLLDELANSGVKYNPDDVVAAIKNSDGKLMWLENGNSKAGLQHILERHADDFASQGVNDIPSLLEEVLSTNPIKSGSNAKGLFADYSLNGNSYRVAYGTNGFIVSFYPID